MTTNPTRPTQPLPRIWVQVPLTATACAYGVDDTWFHVPCQRYFQSALHHDCQKAEDSSGGPSDS